MSSPAVATAHVFRPEFVDPATASGAIETLRGAARSRFESLGLPTRTHEEWRFTPLTALAETPFAAAKPTAMEKAPRLFPGCRHLVFVNGRLDPTLSDLDNDDSGITISTLGRAREASTAVVEAHLGSGADLEDDAIVALNTAQDLEGAFVHLEAGATLSAPLQIVYAATGKYAATYPRTLVIAEEGAAATIIESYVGDEATLSCPVTEIFVGPQARIHHTRLQEVDSTAIQVGALGVVLSDRSSYSLTSLSLGGRLSRLGIDVNLTGEKAHVALDGLTLVDGRRVGDHHIRVEHRVPDCTSIQRFRSVLSDRGRAIFTGRIVVAEGAQATDANQSSRSLVLSPDAVAFNNPQLEIYADDVRCTHGSTVGQLDEEALFYLRARGIGRAQAEHILTRAFAAEVLDGIRVDEVRSQIETTLNSFLGGQTDAA